MIFTHDTEHALAVVVDLINTGAATSGAERLGGLPGLRAFVERNSFSDVGELTEADLLRVLDLRARFHEVFRAATSRPPSSGSTRSSARSAPPRT